MTDSVIEWGRRSIVHVRVWQPLDARLRPVVLLGELDDNDGLSVTNGIETAASTVAAQLLGPHGLHADWYQYRPASLSSNHEFRAVTFSVGPLSKVRPPLDGGWRQRKVQRARLLGGELQNPHWSEISRETLEDLVGEEVEVYPRGSYTRAVVKRHAIDGPFPFDWDPTLLKPDIDAALALLNFEEFGLDSETALFTAFLLTEDCEQRATQNAKSAEEQHRGLGIELQPYRASSVQLGLLRSALGGERPERMLAATSPEALLRHQQRLRRWLSGHGTDVDRLLLVPGSRGWAWLDPWEVGIDEENPHPGPPVAAVVRHAERQLSAYFYENYPDALEADFPSVVPSDLLDGTGRWGRHYLDTVSWWGPRPEDELRAKRLAAQLDDDSEYSAGYDPWGRLVLRIGESFVVEWPLGPMLARPPDAALVVAEESSRGGSPVFIALPDGRLDLLPAPADRPGGTSFTWGYGGGGRFTLAQALDQLVLTNSSGTHGSAWQASDHLVRACKSSEFRVSLRDLRSMIQAAAQ